MIVDRSRFRRMDYGGPAPFFGIRASIVRYHAWRLSRSRTAVLHISA